MNILVGVTGGIAAYKTCELVRIIINAGHAVKVVMTDSAKQFIHPNTFASLIHEPVWDDLFSPAEKMPHIQLAKWADLIVIAPATAHTLSELAHGMAANLLSCVCLASKAPCYLAPAMNRIMWEKSATQHNVKQLQQHNYRILSPEYGEQACGDVGLGRMLEPDKIFEKLCRDTQVLHGLNILITAGPTVEKIDPIRYFSNFSSGKMGYALASAYQQQGANVHLISGPTNLQPPINCQLSRVHTANEMLNKALQAIPNSHIFICAAAIADYAPVFSKNKIKKQSDTLTIELHQTADILKTCTATYPHVFAVGFCAETNDLLLHAQNKLIKKNCHAIVANQITASGYPFDDDANTLTYVTRQQCVAITKNTKINLAYTLISYIQEDFLRFSSNTIKALCVPSPLP